MSSTDRTASYKVQRGITKKIHNQELWMLCSAHRLMMLNTCMKFYKHILNGFKVIERTWFSHRNCYLQSLKYQYKLWFLHSACRLMLVNICMTFNEDILNGFKVIERTWFCHRTANYKLQRDVTKKIHIQELWFLHSACHLLVLNICMKFYEYILNSFKVIERTRFCQETFRLLLKKFKGM